MEQQNIGTHIVLKGNGRRCYYVDLATGTAEQDKVLRTSRGNTVYRARVTNEKQLASLIRRAERAVADPK
jgi:hypothetical protein